MTPCFDPPELVLSPSKSDALFDGDTPRSSQVNKDSTFHTVRPQKLLTDHSQEDIDNIGQEITQQLKALVSAAARQGKLGRLNNMPPTQVESCSAPQPTMVHGHEEQVVNTTLTSHHGHSIPPPKESPFIMSQYSECKGLLCPHCVRGGRREMQTGLSIDGVLKGDFAPAAAMGYGFRCMGGRPVANARVVKNLGLRDPKTGLLPGQVQKIKNEKEGTRGEQRVTAAEGIENTGFEKAQVATQTPKNVQLVEVEKFELVEVTASLNTADKEKPNEHLGLDVFSNDLGNDDGSNEDVIQFYIDSDNNSMGSNAEDKKDVVGVTVNEVVEGHEMTDSEAC